MELKTTWYISTKGVAFPIGLFRVCYGTINHHAACIVSMKIVHGCNFWVKVQGASLHAVTSNVPSVWVTNTIQAVSIQCLQNDEANCDQQPYPWPWNFSTWMHSKSLLVILTILHLKYQPWAISNMWNVLYWKIVYLTSVTQINVKDAYTLHMHDLTIT